MNVQFSKQRACSEIQAARKALQDEKAALQQQVAQLTDDKRNLMLAVTEMYEQNLALEEKNKNVMLATTDLYEQSFDLDARLTALEGGTT